MSSVAIDFDGTITTYTGWRGWNVFDKPVDGIREFLQSLVDRGYTITIHTARITVGMSDKQCMDVVEALEAYMQEHDLPFDNVHVGPGKPIAVAYVDDRAVSLRPMSYVADKEFSNALEAIDELESLRG